MVEPDFGQTVNMGVEWEDRKPLSWDKERSVANVYACALEYGLFPQERFDYYSLWQVPPPSANPNGINKNDTFWRKATCRLTSRR